MEDACKRDVERVWLKNEDVSNMTKCKNYIYKHSGEYRRLERPRIRSSDASLFVIMYTRITVMQTRQTILILLRGGNSLE